MSDATGFVLRAGIPFSRVVRVVDAKNVWPELDDFEIRSQLRVGTKASDTLIANLHPFMTPSYDDGRDLGTVTLTGALLTGDDAAFTDADVGRYVRVEDARGPGRPLVAAIASITDGSGVELTITARDQPVVVEVTGVAARTTDDIVIDWSMTGSQVRAITQTGYYDLVISDPGTDDVRAVKVLAGKIEIETTITSAAGDS